MNKENIQIVVQNKKARHDYDIIDTYDAGLVLVGTEIKSLRLHHATLNDAYCEVKNNEVFVRGFHINKYEMGNLFNHDPDRIKKLLLNKNEILKLKNKRTEEGYTIVPLKVYIKNGLAKMEIAVARGKKNYDKREDLKEADQRRYIDKTVTRY